MALAAAGSGAAATAAETTTQLPRTVRPTHYDVAIEPNPDTLTFDGQVAIAIDVLQPTTSITLNALDLRFRKVVLSGDPADSGFGAARIEVSDTEQTATFSFERVIPPGHYHLALEYDGQINTQVYGLFAIDYDTAAGRRRALYTQFENSDARRMVPSWDEPDYKATFTLEATVPRGQMAVSNMPVAGNRTSAAAAP